MLSLCQGKCRTRHTELCFSHIESTLVLIWPRRIFQTTLLTVATRWCYCSTFEERNRLVWGDCFALIGIVDLPCCHFFLIILSICPSFVASSLSKKTHSVIQTLKKDGVLTSELEQDLKSCRSADELDHVVRISSSQL